MSATVDNWKAGGEEVSSFSFHAYTLHCRKARTRWDPPARWYWEAGPTLEFRGPYRTAEDATKAFMRWAYRREEA